MNILSIGNSFSVDAHMWLHALSKCGDIEISAINLYISGCRLEMHYDNLINHKPEYEYKVNGDNTLKKCSVKEALYEQKYDVVTIQQASGYSGIPESYTPHITEIVKYIKEVQPPAKVLFYETWSYETDFTHKNFAKYNNDQGEMDRRIKECAEMVKNLADIEIIPTGEFIKYLRENTKEFNYKNGGLSLNRDGYHLTFDYGRFAAATLWYKQLAGQKTDLKKFVEENSEFDIGLLNVISDALEEFWIEYNKK